MLLLLLRIFATPNSSLVLVQLALYRELSWFFWIVVFLSVWVIYTTSA